MSNVQPTNPFKFNFQNMKKIKQSLTFSPDGDFAEQRTAILKKLRELIAMPTPLAQCSPIVEAVMTDDPRFDEIRMVFESEPGFFIPAHLIYPKNLKKKNSSCRLLARSFSRHARVVSAQAIPFKRAD